MGQIIKSLASVCKHSYGHYLDSILMKFCTVIRGRKSRPSLFGIKIWYLLPLFYPNFYSSLPTMGLPCSCPACSFVGAKSSIWDQCDIEDRLTTDTERRPTSILGLYIKKTASNSFSNSPTWEATLHMTWLFKGNSSQNCKGNGKPEGLVQDLKK